MRAEPPRPAWTPPALSEEAKQYESRYPWPEGLDVPEEIDTLERRVFDSEREYQGQGRRGDLANAPHLFERLLLQRTAYHLPQDRPDLQEAMRQRLANVERDIPPEERVIENQIRVRFEEENRQAMESQANRNLEAEAEWRRQQLLAQQPVAVIEHNPATNDWQVTQVWSNGEFKGRGVEDCVENVSPGQTVLIQNQRYYFDGHNFEPLECGGKGKTYIAKKVDDC